MAPYKRTNIIIRVDDELKTSLHSFCKANGVTLSDFTRTQLANVINEKVISAKGVEKPKVQVGKSENVR